MDRVLNGRSNVREETVRRVHEAAEAIDREDPALLKEELGDLLLQVSVGEGARRG